MKGLRLGLGLNDRAVVASDPFGPELLANSDFSSGATSWTSTDVAYAGGVATFSTSGSYNNIFQFLSPVPANGKTIRITYEVSRVGTSGTIRARLDSVNGTNRTITTTGIYTDDLVKAGSGLVVLETTGTNVFEGDITLLSAKEVL